MNNGFLSYNYGIFNPSMKKKLYIIAILLLLGNALHAQVLVKGTVVESGSGNKLSDVFVKDVTNKQIALTDKSGKFEIKSETGHTLIFTSPGYVDDTLYVVDLVPKHIELKTRTIALREVNISASRLAFDPHKEYPDVYTKSKVYPLSPSSWFGKEGRNARRLKRYFAHEEQERKVDQVFNSVYVSSIVPLKGQELDDFMTLYRPSYAFITSNNSESLAVYINDSYKKYMALPPDKRHLQKLNGQ
ncbi:MAG: carboxypeptidase-like regulatory protein [Mucilaginibacter sp.]|nr:carboxypeptidase-like regulatory protein [Mucilaginibacter sp.]